MQDLHISKYQVVEKIGHGGFATVYRAHDTVLEREVALKVLDPLLMRDGAFVERFQREARSAARLEHPQIVPIYDVGEGAGRLFISMRLIRGPSLAQYLAEKERLSWKETLRILNEVGDALAYAHEEGIIHRDLKPDNILLDERSGALLTDFGFARLVGTSSLTQSISGGIVGTPAYIPPEIWEGATARPATDVYALACVIYEMLTGKILFGGETPMAIMRAHDRGANLPEEWPMDIPSDARSVLLQALTRKPEQRYASIQAFLEALNAVQTAAVKQRLAEKAEHLYDKMNAALENGAFADAVDLGEELLNLQPDHASGKEFLQEARSKLETQRRLLDQVNAEQERLEAEQRECKHQAAEARARFSEVTSAQEKLEDERKTLQKRLEEITNEIDKCSTEASDLRQHLEDFEKQKRIQKKAIRRLETILSTIQSGDLKEAQHELNRSEPMEPESTEKDTVHSDKDSPDASWSGWSPHSNSLRRKEVPKASSEVLKAFWIIAAIIVIILLLASC